MEQSILKSTKKVLNIDPSYVAFDQDILTHINATFSVLNQLGIGPAETFSIDSDEATWDALALPANQLGLVKSYVYLKVRKLFDPPSTSFHIEAINSQISEFEFRLGVFRDEALAAAEASSP